MRKLIAIGIVVVGVAAFVYYFRMHQVLSSVPVTGTYHNEKYQYEFRIPAGWRLSPSIMLLFNMRSVADILTYTPRNADMIVITKWGPEAERRMRDRLRTEGDSISYLDFLSGSVMLVAADERSIETIQKIGSVTIGDNEQLISSTFEQLSLESGIKATRYSVVNPRDPTRYMENVYLPYLRRVMTRLGDPVNGLTIRTLHDDEFIAETFAGVYLSLRYTGEEGG